MRQTYITSDAHTDDSMYMVRCLREVCYILKKEIYIRLYGMRQSLTRHGFIEHNAD